MEATTPLAAPRRVPAALANIDVQLVSIWLLGFGLPVYLGLKGGGYDPLVGDQAGIVVWWIVLAGLLVGAFPRRRLGLLGWSALGLFAAFAVWTALSLSWTESSGNTSADMARVATYLGVFALGLFIRGSRGVRLMVAAVGTGIAFISIVALLSRLHPAWFPEAEQTARFLGGSKNRLAYPLNYWNAVAALAAIGIPLMLNAATTGKSIALRSLAAATLPAMALTVYLTLSRGGILAGVVAIAVYLTFAGDRVPRLATLAVAGLGGAILIGAASQRDALQEGLLNPAAHHQGNEMLWMVIVVCAGVGLIQAAMSVGLLNGMRPSWTVPSRQVAIRATAAAVVAVLIAAVAFNAPHRISHAIGEFKSGEVASGGASRLTSAAGENRDKLWSAALDEFSGEPLHGTGSGTFEYWWARNGDTATVVRDTHSLYLQTLGELGIVGIIFLGGFIVLILGGGLRVINHASRHGRPQLAAALAGVVAFFLTAVFDWMWQIPVLPVTMLLLAGALVSAGVRSRHHRPPGLKPAARIGLAASALAAIIAIAIPFSSATLIRRSQSDARAANLPAALEAARSAQNVEPDAGLPHLQQALVFEQQGNYPQAVIEARKATQHEATNWRNWLVLSRVQAEAGEARAAVRSYRTAASLNPRSPVFAP
jgi:hypothetical protein